MRKSRKKLLATILAFTMVFGTLPSNVFANNEQEQIHAEIEETVTTDVSENVENENPVEDITEETQEEVNTEEEALPEENADNEVAVDSSLDKIKLEKTEEVIAGEKYIIVYDNKQALSVGKDQVISVPVEIEGEIVKTEITKNMVWTVDDNNNLVSELGKKLSAELTLLEDNGQSFKFNKKNVSYENGEVNNYLTYNEEINKWGFAEENEAVTYYKVEGSTEELEELSSEELEKLEESKEAEFPQEDETSNEVIEEPKVEEDEKTEEVSNEVIADLEEDVPTTFESGDVTYVLDTDGVDSGEQYIIVSNGKMLKNDLSASQYSAENISDDFLWTFTGSNDSFSIKNGINYLSLRSNNNWKLNTTTTETSLTVNRSGNNYRIRYKQGNGNGYLNLNKNQWTYGTYSNSNNNIGYSIQLYKKVVEKSVEAVYFPVTMYDYDASKFNVEGNSLLVDDWLYFTGDGTNGKENRKYRVNQWSSSEEYQIVQGIVKDELNKDVDGGLEFNYPNAGLFSTTTNEDVGRYVYKNVKFPFIYNSDTGYYTFDSTKNHVHFDADSHDDNLGTQLELYSGQQSIDGNTSFFPFNKEGDTSENYHFGMNMSVDFYMTKDGKIKDTNGNEQNIVFDFTGDDDVWIFIDGKLVLDLGGIHKAVGGSIDFATHATENKVKLTYTTSTNTGGIVEVMENEKKNVSGDETYIKYMDLDIYDDDIHTLQLFYLERGAGLSNCRINFNLPQKDTLEVTKQLGSTTPSTNNSFEFKITHSAEENGEYTILTNTNYTLKSIGGNKESNTGSNGIFTLKAGETAIFAEPKVGYYKIEETETTGTYDTMWSVSKDGVSGTQTSQGNTSSVIYVKESNTTTDIQLKKNTYRAVCTNSAKLTINDDTIVLDYGKPVKFNVTDNDNLTNINGAFLAGIAKTSTLTEGDKSTTELKNKFNTNSPIDLDNGNVKIISKDDNGNEIEYIPTKYMDSIDKATYVVGYKVGSGEEETTNYQYANINIIPATTVYYEDNFTAIKKGNEYVSNGIKYSSDWIQVTTDDSGKITPTESFIGVIGNQDNGTVKSDGHPYGNDESYKDDRYFSNGTAMKLSPNSTTTHDVVNGGEEKKRTASFEFVGTGFDLISLTDNTTGTIIVTISKKVEDNYVQVSKKLVNNTYETPNGILYQIPVINCYDLEYGMYEVEITVSNTNFYLDAVRIYNPLGILDSTSIEDELIAYEQYKADGEANANIREVRNILISNNNFGINEDQLGAVYVDVIGNVSADNISAYITNGPNNEVYIKNGQSVAFVINGLNGVTDNGGTYKVQIGLKSPEGSALPCVNGQQLDDNPLNTATDMYYDITTNVTNNSGVVIITNNSEDSILSITNLKITSSVENKTFNITSNISTVRMANMLAYESSSNKSADIDASGAVDIYDLAAVASNQGKEVIIGVSTDIYKQDLTATRVIDRDDLNIVKESIE